MSAQLQLIHYIQLTLTQHDQTDDINDRNYSAVHQALLKFQSVKPWDRYERRPTIVSKVVEILEG
jgi:hypothetical protein